MNQCHVHVQIETNKNTALTLACFQGRYEVVSLLIDRKANIEHRAKVLSSLITYLICLHTEIQLIECICGTVHSLCLVHFVDNDSG